MKAYKWDFKKREYDEVEINDRATTFSRDMEEEVICPQCNKPLIYGDGYTSRQIHTQAGMGFSVCEKCYENEWKEELEVYKENERGVKNERN